MNTATKMSTAEMVTAVEMLVTLAQDNCAVTISTETDGVGLDNAFRATVENKEGIQIATSGGNARLSGALSDVYRAVLEAMPEEDDACEHSAGWLIRGMEGWNKQ